jgi:hypothetical protein
METHGELPAAWVAEAPPSTPDDRMCANWAGGWKVEPGGVDGISLSRAGRARARRFPCERHVTPAWGPAPNGKATFRYKS